MAARTRLLLVTGATAALAILVTGTVAGTVVSREDPPGPGGQTLAAGPGPVPLMAPGAPVSVVEDCDDLLASYVARASDVVGPWGWDSGWYDDGWGGPVMLRDTVGGRVEAARMPLASVAYDAAEAPAAAVAQRAESDESGTNVQETGVDEPDVVKTDGELLVRLDDGVLTTYDVSGGAAPAELGRLVLDRAQRGELLLAGSTVTVVAGRDDGTTRVLSVDLADPAAPTLTTTSDYDARLLEARQHGDTVRLVMTTALPDLPFVHPSRQRTDREATAANRELVAGTTIEDWLPTVTEGEATTPLLECDAVAVPDQPGGLGTVAVVGFPAGEPDDRSVRGVAAAADVAYLSTDHLYLAAGHGAGWGPCCVASGSSVATGPRPYDDDLTGTTTLHDLALEGTDTTYLASGRVDGHVADRWAMDEYAGVLRLAVGPSQETGNFNSVVTLRQDGPTLVEAGRVDDLGVNEQIESVRWFDGLAIVVTFRQIDPLYAVDLSDPDAPDLVGELKIPGFSEYLHPLGEERLVGLGQGPTGERGGWGAQAGLFDVTDLADPRRLDVLSYGSGTQALAGLDPRQVTWLPEVRTLLTVVADGWIGRTGYVSVLTLDGGPMENRMVEVEHGQDVDEVRTVPLPDGRVVLVTGSEVSYFDL
jgi:hypothetical protein